MEKKCYRYELYLRDPISKEVENHGLFLTEELAEEYKDKHSHTDYVIIPVPIKLPVVQKVLSIDSIGCCLDVFFDKIGSVGDINYNGNLVSIYSYLDYKVVHYKTLYHKDLNYKYKTVYFKLEKINHE